METSTYQSTGLKMNKFDYDEIVFILSRKKRAWIVGIFDRSTGDYFKKNFPEGFVYSVEFEDGSSTEVHEDDMLKVDDSNGSGMQK